MGGGGGWGVGGGGVDEETRVLSVKLQIYTHAVLTEWVVRGLIGSYYTGSRGFCLFFFLRSLKREAVSCYA